jgi:Mg2+ and Co2+ transporter CorA
MSTRSILFATKEQDREVDLDSSLVADLADEQLLWVDVGGAGHDAVRAAGETLELPSQAIDGVLTARERATLDRFPDALRLRLVAVQPTAAHEALEPAIIDIIAARNRVLTVHRGDVAAFDRFVAGIHGSTQLGRLDAASFVSALVDSVLAGFLEVVEDVEQRVDALDEQALRTADPEIFLEEVVHLRRRVARLRRALAPLRLAVAPLGRPDLDIPGLGEPWPGLTDRLERVIDTVENARELLIGSFDVFMARHAERTNDIMKALTILNAILLPAAVVAGVMGMNFALGFFQDPANFWIVVALMLVMAATILGVSRWRGWI